MMDDDELDITPQFQSAIDAVGTTQNNIFITGKAGTGKSTLLTYLRETTQKMMIVLAPTGVAALNVSGETIHSFFWFDTNITMESAKKAAESRKKNEIFRQLDAIIIDEISMVRADLLDCVDVYLKTVLRNKKPFGGKQMIFIGDLYQLPPVVTKEDKQYFEDVYDSPYFFSSQAFLQDGFNMQLIELEKIYRQQDDMFIEILNSVRNRSVTDEHIDRLNENYRENCSENDNGYIYLTSTNAGADEVNIKKLSSIKKKSVSFEAKVTGKFDIKPPTEQTLKLKEGAQVMLLNNDSHYRWVNGTIGEIVSINKEEKKIEIKIQDGEIVVVSPHKWELSKYVYDPGSQQLMQESTGSFTQYPLRLSWAITIHKSQGKTFDKVIVDLGRGSFATGQTYVALSRCRSLEGMLFKHRIKQGHVMLDWRVVKFLTQYQYDISEKALSFDDKVEHIELAIAIKEKKDNGDRILESQ